MAEGRSGKMEFPEVGIAAVRKEVFGAAHNGRKGSFFLDKNPPTVKYLSDLRIIFFYLFIIFIAFL